MSCGGGNSWFKKNPWLAERSQVTTRWGKKSPTFDDGDDSMEVFPLNPNVCVVVYVCVNIYIYACVCIHFLITNWPPAHMRPHSHSSAWWFFWVNLKHCIASSSLLMQHRLLQKHRTPVAKKHWLKRWKKRKKTKWKTEVCCLECPWTSHRILGRDNFFSFLVF